MNILRKNISEKSFFDANIILDIALKRDSFFMNAFNLFNLIDQNKIFGNITATTITDIYCISRRERGHDKSIEFLRSLVDVVEVIGIGKDIVIQALVSEMRDFVDAVQTSAAEWNDI